MQLVYIFAAIVVASMAIYVVSLSQKIQTVFFHREETADIFVALLSVNRPECVITVLKKSPIRWFEFPLRMKNLRWRVKWRVSEFKSQHG